MYFNNSLFSVDVCAQYKTAICHYCHVKLRERFVLFEGEVRKSR